MSFFLRRVQVGISNGPLSEPAVVAVVTPAPPDLLELPLTSDLLDKLLVTEDGLFRVDVDGIGFDTTLLFNDVVFFAYNEGADEYELVHPCNKTVNDAVCDWDDWRDTANSGASATRFQLRQVPVFLETKYGGFPLTARVSTLASCTNASAFAFTSEERAVADLQTDPTLEDSNETHVWTTADFPLKGTAFVDTHVLLVAPFCGLFACVCVHRWSYYLRRTEFWKYRE